MRNKNWNGSKSIYMYRLHVKQSVKLTLEILSKNFETSNGKILDSYICLLKYIALWFQLNSQDQKLLRYVFSSEKWFEESVTWGAISFYTGYGITRVGGVQEIGVGITWDTNIIWTVELARSHIKICFEIEYV